MQTIALLAFLVAQNKPTELVAAPVDKAPAIDGSAADETWTGVPETKLTLVKAYDDTMTMELRLRVCRTADEIFFLMTWKDDTKDARHRPFIWDKKTDAYSELEDVLEDVASLAFELEGEFDANMLAGKPSKWDVWQWKAARTNGAGFAMDKWHQYARHAIAKARKFVATDGKPVWILRAEDAGKSVTARADKPEKHQGDEAAQFMPQTPDGSAADVRAKGVWQDKRWTLELARKLKTGHADDAAFEVGKSRALSVAIFDHEEHGEHWVAGALKLVVK